MQKITIRGVPPVAGQEKVAFVPPGPPPGGDPMAAAGGGMPMPPGAPPMPGGGMPMPPPGGDPAAMGMPATVPPDMMGPPPPGADAGMAPPPGGTPVTLNLEDLQMIVSDMLAQAGVGAEAAPPSAVEPPEKEEEVSRVTNKKLLAAMDERMNGIEDMIAQMMSAMGIQPMPPMGGGGLPPMGAEAAAAELAGAGGPMDLGPEMLAAPPGMPAAMPGAEVPQDVVREGFSDEVKEAAASSKKIEEVQQLMLRLKGTGVLTTDRR